ncbi:exocyst complex component SEC3B-like [Camellia sinensis]|uniref:exocyst complex component SEC3B-like n=1 Tax=Camellia sinensis TaxID=4442 RepID=UPI001036386B|nr:exocyst complex component SEC3B-like [Camellia sinensis]XP_028085411.1 exocyst complex component SEC3B-like [Camellia sinensis]
MYTITQEEIPFQLGLSKLDLRKVVKSSLSGVDKSITAMYKKLQKNLTSEEVLPSLWDKCKTRNAIGLVAPAIDAGLGDTYIGHPRPCDRSKWICYSCNCNCNYYRNYCR